MFDTMDEFIFDKKTSTGFLISVTFQDSCKKNGNNIPCEMVLSDHEEGIGIDEVRALQNLLFDYIEAFGIPSKKTSFHTPKLIHDIVWIGILNQDENGKIIHFNIYSWG